MLLASALWLTLILPQAGDPPPVRVVGSVELTPGAALAAARASAASELSWEIERRALAVVSRTRPSWLPKFVADAQFRRWLRGIQPERGLRVVGQDTRVHDHGDYVSYQAELSVEHDEEWTGSALTRLHAGMERVARRFALGCGGTVGLWGLLALLYAWFDRLSRGYMSWRLRLLFGGMGIAVPGIALLLV